jgi:hypothetical protein
MFWKAYTATTPLTLIILSYKIASSKHLLHIHKRFYQYLPEGLKRELDTDNTTELSFKGGGRIIAAAATQAGGLVMQSIVWMIYRLLLQMRKQSYRRTLV